MTNFSVAARRANQVTQRPGSSRLATSVSTLTTGSQATARLPVPDLIQEKWRGGCAAARLLDDGDADQHRGIGKHL